MFLAAIVTANLLVQAYGQPALVVTSTVLIPFDLVTRDVLHERWRSSYLALRMAALIAAGSVLTAIVTAGGASRVAVASTVAFATAATVNAVAYWALDRRKRLVKMNVSNAAAAVADSVVFPLVAFGAADPFLSALQASGKFFGGLFWSWLVVRKLRW